MFLSIFVPVYNAQLYLEACLDSLLDQDLTDYEIICVDDGSEDDSPAILDAYARRYANLRVLHQHNQGVAAARNAALAVAEGTYVWFVDADDLLRPNVLSRLRALAEESHCQRLVVGAYQFNEELAQEEWRLAMKGGLPCNAPFQDAVVWRNLLRRDFLTAQGLAFRYPELTHGEDGLFLYELCLSHPETAEHSEVVYFYRQHAGSAETAASRENRERKLRSYLRITEILHGYYCSGRTEEMTADKLMSFLWLSLYEIAKLPGQEAKPALRRLHGEGLFPCRRLPQCTLEHSYMTEWTGWRGEVLDWLYLHLHTRWGFFLVRGLQRLRCAVKQIS